MFLYVVQLLSCNLRPKVYLFICMTDIVVKKYPVTQLTITVFSFLCFLFNHYLIMCFLSAFVFSFTKIFVK